MNRCCTFWEPESMGLPSAAPSRSRAGQRGLFVVLQSRRRHSSRRWSTSPGQIALLALVGGLKLLTPHQRRQCSDQITSRPQVTREHGLNVPTVCTHRQCEHRTRPSGRRSLSERPPSRPSHCQQVPASGSAGHGSWPAGHDPPSCPLGKNTFRYFWLRYHMKRNLKLSRST